MKKLLLIMNVTFVLILFSLMQVSASVYSQGDRLTLELRNATVEQIISEIKTQSDLNFIYRSDLFQKTQPMDVRIEDAPIETVLHTILTGNGFTYEISNNTVIIRKAGERIQTVIVMEVRGKVTSTTGESLPGVNVVEKGTTNGTVTDIDGNYRLDVAEDATLIFSFIGYKKEEMAVNGRSVVDMTMAEDVAALNEFVVTGYQTISKERVTGSFSTVTAQDLKRASSSFNLKNVIEDLVPGLYFEPNYVDDQNPTDEDSRSIVIRGVSTFGDNNPLIVVDGFPLDPDVSDPWATINPDDVESVTVLKDASAASIWGAQAANGVIVIVTKKGTDSGSKPIFNMSLDFVTSPKPDLSKVPWASSEDAIDIYRWMVMEHDWVDDLLDDDPITGRYDTYELSDVMRTLVDMKAGNISESAGNVKLAELSQLDVRDEFSDLFLRQETKRRFNLSMQSGSQQHKIRTSITAISNNGYAKGNSDYSFLANIRDDYSPAKWLKFSTGLSLTLSGEDNNGVDINEISNIPQHSRILDENGDYLPMIRNESYEAYYGFPTDNRRNVVDRFNLPYSWDWNLKQEIDNRDNTEKSADLRLNAKVIVSPIKELSAEISYQYARTNSLSSFYYNEESWTVRHTVNNNYDSITQQFNAPPGGMLTERRLASFSHDVRLQLLFNKKIGEHEINALGGMEIRKDYYEAITSGYYGYDPQSLTSNTNIDYKTAFVPKLDGSSPYWSTIPAHPGSYYAASPTGKDSRFISYYGNLAYTYNDRYDLTGSIRLDKANLFGRSPSSRDLPQWSTGIGWTISKEPFFAGAKQVVDRLRLRASYGFNGNVDKSASPYIYGYAWTDPVSQLPYSAVQSAPNPNLTWEKTKVINVGAEFTLFKNKLSGTLEYYTRATSDVLVQTAVNGTFGFQNNRASVNAGDIKNTGVELSLSPTLVNRGDFLWRANFNIAGNKNKTSNYTAVGFSLSSYLTLPYYYHWEGQPVSYLAAMRWAGYDEEGLPQYYYGKNNTVKSVADGSIPVSDRDSVMTIIGQRDPKVFGSFSNSFTYKNFELNIRLSYKFGHKFFGDYPPNSMGRNYFTESKYFTWFPGLVVNRWQQAGDEETASMYSLEEPITSSATSTNIQYLEQYGDHKAMDAGQIRLQAVNLSYRLPASTIKWVKNAVIQVEARNLGAIWVANDKGIDPANPPYSSSSYGALRYVTRYRPEYSIGLKVGL